MRLSGGLFGALCERGFASYGSWDKARYAVTAKLQTSLIEMLLSFLEVVEPEEMPHLLEAVNDFCLQDGLTTGQMKRCEMFVSLLVVCLYSRAAPSLLTHAELQLTWLATSTGACCRNLLLMQTYGSIP
eukprot:5247413-Amphidinium_carterae.1